MIRLSRRMVPAIACLLIAALMLFKVFDVVPDRKSSGPSALPNAPTDPLEIKVNLNSIADSTEETLITATDLDIPTTHREIRSVSSKNGGYFKIDWGRHVRAINPNIIPHPIHEDTWIVVAQLLRPPLATSNSVFFTELVCTAVFKNDVLECTSPPQTLPIAATPNGKDGNGESFCKGVISWFDLNIGPHDARVFWGPEHPYTMFGSNSLHTCFGMWAQDFRVLVDWGSSVETTPFRQAIEISRPQWGEVEKNWFFFWDESNQTFVHYDIYPQRSFSKLEIGGAVGPDLATQAPNDKACLDKYMPNLDGDAFTKQSIHQSTNSLAVTFCDRSDDKCVADSSNTFVMAIFQHKKYVGIFGAVYEPYVALFTRRAPYGLFALSNKPFWIGGRGGSEMRGNPTGLQEAGAESFNRTEMIYITSMTWKNAGQRYHGYQDDVLFLGFGVEDNRTAGIDIRARDLLQDLSPCSELAPAR